MADITFTFGDQLDLLSVLLGDPQTSTDDMFPLAIRKKYINMGELQFANDSKALREYATGSVASQAITLPTDWLETHVLVVGDTKADHLEIAVQDYERYLNSGDNHWYMWAVSDVKKIIFVSTAVGTSSYKLWYFKKPTTALDDTTDTSIIPIEYRQASVYWSAWQLLQQIGKTELANYCLSVYSSYVNSAMGDVKRQYMDRVNPNVDVDTDGQTLTDVQGKGYPY